MNSKLDFKKMVMLNRRKIFVNSTLYIYQLVSIIFASLSILSLQFFIEHDILLVSIIVFLMILIYFLSIIIFFKNKYSPVVLSILSLIYYIIFLCIWINIPTNTHDADFGIGILILFFNLFYFLMIFLITVLAGLGVYLNKKRSLKK